MQMIRSCEVVMQIRNRSKGLYANEKDFCGFHADKKQFNGFVCKWERVVNVFMEIRNRFKGLNANDKEL